MNDEHAAQLTEKVAQLEVAVATSRTEQTHLIEAINKICDKLDRYVDESHRQQEAIRKEISKVARDLGDRPPRTPTAFSQLQDIKGFTKRTRWWFTSAIAAVVSVLVGITIAVVKKIAGGD